MFELIKILEKLDSQGIEKDIVILKDNKEFGIGYFYIMDETFYLEIVDKTKGKNNMGLLYIIECEAEDEDCWKDDIYRSAMSRLADCDAKLIMAKDLEDDNFENAFNFKIIENEENLVLEVI